MYKFNIKRTGPLEFHFRADFYCDSASTMYIVSRKYIECLISFYEKFLWGKPSIKVHSLLEKDYYPEFDDSKLLD